MIMEMIFIVVLLVFIGFGLYVLILDVTRWHAKDGNATPISLPLAAARSVSSVPTASPARADTRRSMSGKHHDFRAATLEGTIGDFQVKELVAQMRDPSKGLPVKTRYYNLKKRQACFTGAEAVDWFLASLHLKAREEALQYGEKLLMRGIIHNVSRLYPFADRRELLYRFSKRTRPHSLPFARCTLTHTYTILNTAASLSPLCLFSSLTPHPSASHDELPLPDARFFEFAEQMRHGLQKSEKKYRSRSWPAAFHGSDAITWVQKALNLTSRDMASKVATEIMERVRIHHLATGHRGECLACDLSRAGSVCTLLSDPRRVRSTT